MGWIDVEKGNPPDDDGVGFSEVVLVTNNDGTMCFSYYSYDEKLWIRLDGTDNNKVIGWTYLPEPYKRK